MIAVDTNLLIYAHRGESVFHEQSLGVLRQLAEGQRVWGIPWTCLHEFLSVVTHPRVFDPPSTAVQAFDQLDAWLASPVVRLLGENDRYFGHLRQLITSASIAGPRVHDARIAAVCLANGVTELWSADRDFGRFPVLRVRNPLVQ